LRPASPLDLLERGHRGAQVAEVPAVVQFRRIDIESRQPASLDAHQMRLPACPKQRPYANHGVLQSLLTFSICSTSAESQRPRRYVIRVKVPAGVRMMPHRHPEDRVYTVISGVFYIGLGEMFDETKLTAYAPGSVVVLPGHQSHFHWAKSGDYVSQVTALGPLGMEYLDHEDDPRNRA
jgi:quercetin dioxygenase-like cupin family protein